MLTAEEARATHDAIDITTPVGLRDHALSGAMVYTFARVDAAIGVRVEDVYVQGRRTWVRLHEKGGMVREMPCHHNLDKYVMRISSSMAWRGKAGVPFPVGQGEGGVHAADEPG